ncbi:MAG: c-type cytochrome [Pseudomonadota bacterium]|nr:c-type cytochrome [Pseudomonadota bacterium]
MRIVILCLALIAALPLNTTSAFDRYTAHGGPIKGLAYSEKLGLLVSTSFDYTAVVWDSGSMKELKQLIGHNAAVNTAAFSPDGRWLATAGDDNQILLWDVSTLRGPQVQLVPRLLDGHTAKVVDLAFSADGKYLASASWDRRVGIWDISALKLKHYLSGHQGPVNTAKFSGDGRYVYSGGADGHIRLWRLATGEYLRSVVRNGFGINVMDLSPELNVLAYGGSNGMMRSISINADGPEIELWNGGPPVLAVTIDPQTKKMIFSTSEGRVVIADALVGEIEHDFRAVKGPIWAMQLANAGEDLFFAGLDDWVTKISVNDFIVPHPLADRERRFHPDQPIDNGQKQFARKCSVCHSLTASSKRRAGPTLYGVFGRKVGAVEDYPYSKELTEMDLVWNEETIDLLFKDGPDIVTPGSKMPVQRIKGKQDRADLISYLKRATAPQ